MLRAEWLLDPDFSEWLSGYPDDPYAFCKLCQSTFQVKGISSLRAHAGGKKHDDLVQKHRLSIKNKKRPSRRKTPASGTVSGSTSQKSQVSGVNVSFNLTSSPTATNPFDIFKLARDKSSTRKGKKSFFEKRTSQCNISQRNAARSSVQSHKSPRVDRSYSTHGNSTSARRSNSPVDLVIISPSQSSESPRVDRSTSQRNSPAAGGLFSPGRSPYYRSPSSSSEDSLEEKDSITCYYADKAKQMLCEHRSKIEKDVEDFVKSYKSATERMNFLSSWHQERRYYFVKKHAYEYVERHKNLEKEVEEHLVNAMNF